MHQAGLPRGDYTHHVTLAVEPAPDHRDKPVPSSWTIRVVRFEGMNVEHFYKFDVHGFVVSKYKHPTDVLERIWVLLGDIRNVAWRAMYGALRICINMKWGYEKYRTHCLMPLAWLFYSDPVIIAYYNRHTDWWTLSASTVPDLVRGNTVPEFHQDLLCRM
ncbi:hypothetical protein QFC22_006502 [Naganishia vaughanmartiniae]|uniref:Uncharacterized protein n=1 Tax=Naganishia vaughanmartiniae TaxID=1424756 RepID=A0ACC2WI99_9TREE|nr:hypothetical protein QFC22_006502 [Naganishia vaughanmartiniae]